MEYKTYSDEDVLDNLRKYFIYKFKLDENRDNIMLFYNKDFWFSCTQKSTMDRIDTIKIREIYMSCNDVDSSDDLFYDEEDLLDELNGVSPGGDVVEYMCTYMREVYGAICISE